MDVVKRSLEALHGTIEIDSEQDQGTRMRIRLPLTLAIIDGFMLGVDDSCYVIPLDSVVECVEFSVEDKRLNSDNDFIDIRGEMLPLLRLRELFDFPQNNHSHENIVVVQYAGQLAGIVVDELLGEFQTVVKPMSKIFSQLSWVNGSTILGSGDVAIILEVAGLVQIAKKRFSQHQQLKAV
jgi:two-component system chemotaxis sensor kinase CheA